MPSTPLLDELNEITETSISKCREWELTHEEDHFNLLSPCFHFGSPAYENAGELVLHNADESDLS